MSKTYIEAPDWLRQTESILEEMNEGVAIVDDQLRVVFANEALLRLGQYRLPAPRNAPHGIRGPFPTHNPTHILRCLVGLLRLLAVPAVL